MARKQSTGLKAEHLVIALGTLFVGYVVQQLVKDAAQATAHDLEQRWLNPQHRQWY